MLLPALLASSCTQSGRGEQGTQLIQMKKSTKSLLACAALAGLYSGALATRTVAATSSSDAGVKISKQFAGDSKHDCKGKNDCSGKGGCKSSDNGCKGKNSCKGKGGCSTADKPSSVIFG